MRLREDERKMHANVLRHGHGIWRQARVRWNAPYGRWRRAVTNQSIRLAVHSAKMAIRLTSAVPLLTHFFFLTGLRDGSDTLSSQDLRHLSHRYAEPMQLSRLLCTLQNDAVCKLAGLSLVGKAQCMFRVQSTGPAAGGPVQQLPRASTII